MSDPAITATSRRAQMRAQQEAQEAAPALPQLTRADLPGRTQELHLAGRDYAIERPEPSSGPDGSTRQLNVPVPSDLDDVIVQLLHACERSGYRKVTKALLIRAWLELGLEGGGGVQQIVDRAVQAAYPNHRP